MNPTLQFLGAAQTVTGSKFLLESGGQQVLVDCGLFQGSKELTTRNWNPLPLPAAEIDAVVVTHAHIDHTGYLPKLVEQGFKGKIFCTPATKELLGLVLPDSGHLQEEEALFANKKKYTQHPVAKPLYTKEDAVRCLEFLETLDYGREAEIAKGIRVKLQSTGHILGAAYVEAVTQGRRIVLSGDVGGYDNPIMRDPSPIPADTDYLLVESTYGGRKINHQPIQEQLEAAMRPTLAAGGVVVIPAFAIGRTTIVLYHLRKLQEAKRLPECPVYVDSPMATDAAEIYCRYGHEHNLKVDMLKSSADCPIRTRNTHLVRSREDSQKLNDLKGPAVIIAASGMATGGRILHHLSLRLPDPKNLALLVGYQAAGTRGRQLLEGAKTLRLFGQDVPVQAKVMAINGLSAHGDADDMIRWMKTAGKRPKKVFLVHGEPEALAAMQGRVTDEVGLPHYAPAYMEKVELE
jgi:metallo-beta-lactamase family protein